MIRTLDFLCSTDVRRPAAPPFYAGLHTKAVAQINMLISLAPESLWALVRYGQEIKFSLPRFDASDEIFEAVKR